MIFKLITYLAVSVRYILVYWCIDVCIDVLVYFGVLDIGVLMYWCIGILM